MEFLKTQMNKDMLIYECFIYSIHSEKNTITRWRFIPRPCKVALYLDVRDSITKSIEHSHKHDAGKCEVMRLKHNIRTRATETSEPAIDIITNHSINVDDAVTAIIPALKSIKRTINRQREKLDNFVVAPGQDIPIEMQVDKRGEMFLRYDSGVADPERIVIFVSSYKEKYLERSTIFLIDGTFKVAPSNFKQLVTIHGIIFGKSYVLAYILLNDKTQMSYQRAFKKIHDLYIPQIRYVITDFELALHNAVKETFLMVSADFCWFHFKQALTRNIDSKKITNDVRTNEYVRKYIIRITYLAFVPPGSVISSYNFVVTNTDITTLSICKDFTEYFVSTYLYRLDKNNNFVPGIYGIENWNVYYRTLCSIPRTNNMVEGWNNGFNYHNEISHPNLARLISKMKTREESDRIAINQALIGRFGTINHNLKKEEKLKFCLQSFQFVDALTYLDLVDKIFKFKFDFDDE